MELIQKLLQAGITNLSIGDTLGAADPDSVKRLLQLISEKIPPRDKNASPLEGIALHLHDTYKRALTNAQVGLEHGIEEFDTSAGGLGGCPFAPGARGNLDTAAFVEMLHGEGISTGIDLKEHRKVVDTLLSQMKKKN